MPDGDSPSTRWLKMGQAEAYTGRKRRWILARVEEGHIDGKKVRGQWVIDRLSIDAYFSSDSDARVLDMLRRAGA